MRRERGVTLTELMIAMTLISIAFLGAANVYVTALRFFNDARSRTAQIYGFLVMEHVARKAALANEVIVNDGGNANNAPVGGIISGQQVKLRWDYAPNTFAPRNTPDDTTDDSWIKYRLVGGRLYWRADATIDDDVGAGAPSVEIEQGATFGGGSGFGLLTPTGAGAANVLRIRLETETGGAPDTVTLLTDVATGAKAKA